jgi:phospholipase D-like protein
VRRSKQWKEFGRTERTVIVPAGAAQVALQAAALIDLRRRSGSELTAPKRLWVALSFVNFLGPVAYFLVGRRSHR